MTTARALINDRRRRASQMGDSFLNRLLRLDRNRAALRPSLMVFKSRSKRRAA